MANTWSSFTWIQDKLELFALSGNFEIFLKLWDKPFKSVIQEVKVEEWEHKFTTLQWDVNFKKMIEEKCYFLSCILQSSEF